MKAYAIDFKQNSIRAFSSERVAQQMGNGLVVFSSAEELAQNRNTTHQNIVAVYNNFSKVMVKRFSDIPTGAKRILKVAESLPIEKTPFEHLSGEKQMNSEHQNDVEIHVKSADAPKKRGRNSGYEGKMIKCLVEKNPRRENTHGFHSMGILINAGEPVSYESYIAQGGRRQDLAWDINKGYAEAV
jgi:hypothetical protein